MNKDELFETLQAEEESTDFIRINPDSRQANVLESQMILGVRTDKNTERKHFIISRIVGDNVDLTKYTLYILWENAGGTMGRYIVNDVKVSGNDITFSWLIDNTVTVYVGKIHFTLCATKVDSAGKLTNEWNTTLATGTVLEGLEVNYPVIEKPEKDTIAQLLQIVRQTSADAVKDVTAEGDKQLKRLQDAGGVPPELLEQVKQNRNDILFTRKDLEEVANITTIIDIAKNIYSSVGRTEGYYLSEVQGKPVANAEYMYSDYQNVEPNTTYCFSTQNYPTIVFFIAEYDKNKKLISSVYHDNAQRTFKTATNTKYICVSANKNYVIQIEKGEKPTNFEEHHESKKFIKDAIYNFIVGKNEKYKTISSAVKDAVNGDVIYIKNGIYDECVNCDGKILYLFGESQDGVKVIRDNNDYTNPPLNFFGGEVKNMTFVQTGTQSPSVTNNVYNAYACHIDFQRMENKTLVFENCTFECSLNSGVGMGGWNNCLVKFSGCTFITHSNSKMNGSIIMHNNAYNTSKDSFIFERCNFIANEGAMCIKVQAFNTKGNHTNVTFIYCTSSHNSHWLSNVETATVYKWSDLWNYELTNDSYGNKIEICNAPVISKQN